VASTVLPTSPCHGNRADPCCYVEGVLCRFVEQGTVPGRRWACGLLRKLGSWEGVHADLGYQWHVQQVWNEVGIESCGAWGPGTGQCCFGEGDS